MVSQRVFFGERYAPRQLYHVLDMQFDISNAPSITVWGARGPEDSHKQGLTHRVTDDSGAHAASA